jgi:hypothetical protein
MKTNKFLLTGMLLSAMAFTGCTESFLEVDKPDGDNLDTYYTNQEHIEEAVIAAYDPIHWHDWGLGQYNAYNICADIMSDDVYVGGANYDDMKHWHMLADFVGNGDNTLGTLWTIDYSGIKRCNDALFYMDNYAAGKLSSEYEAKARAQVRAMRVYYYNNLWHYFGNIPFYLQNLGEPPYTAPQLSADEVYNKLIVELEEVLASDVLPMKWDNANAGRVSQAMAIMMYAEMVAYQNDESRFSKALTYLKAIIGSGLYDLFPNFKDYWDTANEWNQESIWEINYDKDITERDWGDAALNIGGMVIPTLISPNQYPGDDEWGAGQDGWGFMPIRKAVKTLLAGDNRLAGTVWEPTLAYTKRNADTGLWLQKYRPYEKNNKPAVSSANLNYSNNFRYYRYSEALLYAAEFAVRTGADQTSADQWVTKVRQRAGLGAISGVTIDNILTERHKEFIGEGKRYFDLVRAEGIAGVSAQNKATGALVPLDPATEGVAADAAIRTRAWTANKKYIPIAQAELDSDPELKQNTAYFQ